ncbi:excinuclease ABC subunit B [Nonlabens tegetincola]|uniref:Excinuclease ABC subunit B n=2 Tax=Nonlabens TaxID=363408 RepID=A0A090Q5Q4_9FLAO|nr:excinuclease ABC subunit B [Nonlabens tegetincola]
MQKTIDETEYRRSKQIAYNEENGLTPTAIKKSLDNTIARKNAASYAIEEVLTQQAAEEEAEYLSKEQLDKKVRDTRKAMEKAAKELDFMEAARLRDQLKMYQEKASS